MDKLCVKNVSKSFEDMVVIDHINLSLGEGEVVCLLGASGAGKTTLFNVISGIAQPDCGQVFLNGQEITGQPGKISYMLQKDLLLPHMTIEDNVALSLLVQGKSKKEARQQVAAYFETFGLAGTQKKYPHQLSGGMCQRAALLRTYMFSNEVALLDEPFSALDALTKRSMHGWFAELMKTIHMSALMITHDIDEALLLADRICLLNGKPGTVTKEIVLRQLKNNEENFELSQAFRDTKMEILSELGL